MGKLIERVFGRNLATWIAGLPLKDSRTAGFFYTRESSSGREVTPQDALSLSAIFAAVRLYGQVIGMLPLTVYQTKPDGGKRSATTNPAYKVLRTSPNPWMTAKSFRQTMEIHRRLWGNAYAEIVWNYGGAVRELWPIEPWRVRPELYEGDLRYCIDGGRAYVAKEDMLHIPLMSFNGVVGRSFVDFAIDSIGLNLSAQDFAGAFFANGGQASGILSNDGNPKKEQRDEIREGWEHRHVGRGKSHRTGVLWGGWKYTADTGAIEPIKSQLLEQRQFGIQEAARLLELPPHLLGDLSRSTFSNMEESQIQAVVYSFQPAAVDYEQEYDRKLLNHPEAFSKHNFAGLLRGNMAARAAFYKELFQVGGITVNRILELEDEDPVGPMGDLRFVPLNMQTLQQAERSSKEPPKPPPPAKAPPAPPPADTPPADNKPGPGLTARLWMSDVLDRLMRKEINALKRAAERPENFLGWLDTFYEGHQAVLAQALTPVTSSCDFTLASAQLADQWVKQSRKELLELSGATKPAKFSAAIAALATQWEANRTIQAIASLLE